MRNNIKNIAQLLSDSVATNSRIANCSRNTHFVNLAIRSIADHFYQLENPGGLLKHKWELIFEM